jgi:hypothetical protein
LKVFQRGLPGWLFDKPYHRPHLSMLRVDAISPRPRLSQGTWPMPTHPREGRHLPPHRYGWVLDEGHAVRHRA